MVVGSDGILFLLRFYVAAEKHTTYLKMYSSSYMAHNRNQLHVFKDVT